VNVIAGIKAIFDPLITDRGASVGERAVISDKRAGDQADAPQPASTIGAIPHHADAPPRGRPRDQLILIASRWSARPRPHSNGDGRQVDRLESDICANVVRRAIVGPYMLSNLQGAPAPARIRRSHALQAPSVWPAIADAGRKTCYV